MAVITITAAESAVELISGIPQVISLYTNVPATVFFTVDGTEPTAFSEVYVGPIEMPTTVSVRLRAIAISGPDMGLLDIIYSTDSTDLSRDRRTEDLGIGIAVDAYGVDSVLTDGYGPDADNYVVVPVRSSDEELENLEIKFSRTGLPQISPGTIITLGPVPESQRDKVSAIDEEASSPNNQNVYFNPKSLYIVMDGRDGYEDQSVFSINRPHGSTMDVTKYLQGKTLYEPQPYVSGGLVRTLYNRKEGRAVSYYFDHNETRWIKSIQSFDPDTIPANIGSRRQVGPPLIFKWIYNRRSMI
jgi:hypothetical protein